MEDGNTLAPPTGYLGGQIYHNLSGSFLLAVYDHMGGVLLQ